MLKLKVFIQPQLVRTISEPWSRKIESGSKLIKNAVRTAVFTRAMGNLELSTKGVKAESRG